MTNTILSAINNIATFKGNDLQNYASTYLNRINAVGEQLEFYVKDSIAGTFKKKQTQKEAIYAQVFSYLGNQNNPPDMIIKGGDAFEIKKLESPRNALALNSSPPKNRLYCSDGRITAACRNCEDSPWEEKDLFYVIGYCKDKALKYLFFIHACCYAADKSVYEKIHAPLKSKITNVLRSQGLEHGDTVELGKVRKADPLGITELRIRGMWQIENPLGVYPELLKFDESKKLSVYALLSKDKFLSYPQSHKSLVESNRSISLRDVKIKNPNNPAKMIESKLISFCF